MILQIHGGSEARARDPICRRCAKALFNRGQLDGCKVAAVIPADKLFKLQRGLDNKCQFYFEGDKTFEKIPRRAFLVKS